MSHFDVATTTMKTTTTSKTTATNKATKTLTATTTLTRARIREMMAGVQGADASSTPQYVFYIYVFSTKLMFNSLFYYYPTTTTTTMKERERGMGLEMQTCPEPQVRF
jgi:hypothetical protein